MDGASEAHRFLAQHDDSFGRQRSASGTGVPTQRQGGESGRNSEEDIHRARLAVARGARDAQDCRMLLEMLGLVPGEQGGTALPE